MQPLAPALQFLLAVLVSIAAVTDIRSRRIPNWLTVGGLAAGVALNAFLFGMAGLKQSGLGFALAFGVYMVLYVLRAKRAGDVKLMAAVGAISGPGQWLLIFVIASIVGGLVALLMVFGRGRAAATFWNVRLILSEMVHLRAPHKASEELDVRSDKSFRLPGGAVIALGTLLVLAWQNWMVRLAG